MSFSANPIWTILDSSGDPVVSGTIEFYEAGTSTPKNAYSDEARATAIGTSDTTDANGQVGPIYLDRSADTKIVAKNAAGTTLWTVDNLQAPVSTNSGVVDPLSYGAVGDGATDDSAALQSAIDAAAVSTIDLGGKTYKCDSQLTLKSDLTIRNGTLDFTDLDSVSGALSATGTAGSTITLTAGAAIFDQSLTMDSGDASGLAAGDWLLVFDAATDWESGVDIGCWAHVKSISGGTVNVWDVLRTAGASCKKISGCERMVLEDLTIITGAPVTDQAAVELTRCQDVTINRVRFKGGDAAHIYVTESRNVRITDCETVMGAQAVTTFLDVVSGCADIYVAGCMVYTTAVAGNTFDLGSTTSGDLVSMDITLERCVFRTQNNALVNPSVHNLKIRGCVFGGDYQGNQLILRTAEGQVRDCDFETGAYLVWQPARAYSMQFESSQLGGIEVRGCRFYGGFIDIDDYGDASGTQDSVDITIADNMIDAGTQGSDVVNIDQNSATNNTYGHILVAGNRLLTASNTSSPLDITGLASTIGSVTIRNNNLQQTHASAGTDSNINVHCDVHMHNNQYSLKSGDLNVVIGNGAAFHFIGNASLSTTSGAEPLTVTTQTSATPESVIIANNTSAIGSWSITLSEGGDNIAIVNNVLAGAGDLSLIVPDAKTLSDARVSGNQLLSGELLVTAQGTLERTMITGNLVHHVDGSGANASALGIGGIAELDTCDELLVAGNMLVLDTTDTDSSPLRIHFAGGASTAGSMYVHGNLTTGGDHAARYLGGGTAGNEYAAHANFHMQYANATATETTFISDQSTVDPTSNVDDFGVP